MPAIAPHPIDLSHHYSYTTKNRLSSFVKSFYKYYQIPGLANFAGGLPHQSYFPYDTLEANIARPDRLKPVSAGDSRPERLVVPKQSQVTDVQRRIDLTTALQYGTAEGYPALLSFLRQFTRDHLHPNVPYAGGPEIILSCGNTDGFSKAIELLTNIWNPDRDWIRQREGVLCEQFAYMNAIQTVKPRGLNVIGVAMDEQGMSAFGEGGLADVLENWDFRRGRRPHVMYTVTMGQNPTGGVLQIERKKEIYALCQKYDVIIVEDEPYWNLQYPSAYEMEARARGSSIASPQNYNARGKSSGYPFLDALAPSYLSIDTEGRVIRLDTFSKSIAPGSRLGWITAQPAIIERLTRITECSTQQPSGFVQSIVAEMLMGKQDGETKARVFKLQDSPGWQMDGWVHWLEGLREGYEKRMQSMCTILEDNKFFLSGSSDHAQDWEVVDRAQMFEFIWPKAGMFTWIEVYFEAHPLASQYSPQRLSSAFWVHLTQKPALCLIGPGSMFAASPESVELAYKYFRLSFAPMNAEDVAHFTQRLVDGVRSFWQRKSLDGLEDADTLDMRMLQLNPEANFLGTGC